MSRDLSHTVPLGTKFELRIGKADFTKIAYRGTWNESLNVSQVFERNRVAVVDDLKTVLHCNTIYTRTLAGSEFDGTLTGSIANMGWSIGWDFECGP